MNTAHDFSARTSAGAEVPLDSYAGKHLLIVNVASKCGLTPQYEGLEALYRDRRGDGLEIVGFPTNQFMGQEPGTDDEIQEFCKLTYDVTFPIFAKVDVNGEDAEPLYRHLRAMAPGESSVDAPGEVGDIKWNFTKFLVGPEGSVLKRYEPQVTPEEIRDDLENYL